MPDLPDFSTGIWDQREVKARDVEIKYCVFTPTEDVQPGPIYYSDVYTVPTGKRYFCSDCYGATTFRGSIAVYVPGSHDIYTAFFEPYDTHFASLALPIPVESGETIRVSWQNTDRVPGTFRLLLGIWWEPGSIWEKPKSDDPLERFLKGDFNYAQYFLNPDGSYSVIFRRAKEEKSNYLRIENPYKPNQKVLTKFNLKLEESQEIIEISRQKPEKLIETLKNYEEKYKNKKRWFFV
jgi:hypothetical protein